ncbi:MAG TPA: NAD-dependent epimerase/dehydratase family protein [Ilumatobacteraceae bacterium]|jgi:nucleoside-diphosphate-sugar epimerase
MKVVIFGATGNVGSALVRSLEKEDRVTSIVGVARRLPLDVGASAGGDKVTWDVRDISYDELDVVADADVVVDLAWKIQPSHHEATMLRTNVIGTHRVMDAVALHSVPSFVYASSVGTYAPHPKHSRADESWSAAGIPSSTYSRHKADVEKILDTFERAHSDIRVVRMRTSLVFQRSAASEIHRLFLGRLLPWHLPRPLRLVPNVARLQFQATHADDIADAYRRAIVGDVAGAFNVAAEPVLDPKLIADTVAGRTVPLPETLLRKAAAVTYRLRIQPSEPGWLDMALQTPLMDTTRARNELGWVPAKTSVEALAELLDGIGDGSGYTTLPLHPRGRAG